jgi:acetoacetyl-CoA synthetase
VEASGVEAERGEKLWEPSPERLERATMTRYMAWLGREHGLDFDGYAQLWEWSVNELEDFWGSIWDFFEVRSEQPYRSVLAERVMPGARWFEGAEVNYAEHLLGVGDDDAPAVQHAAEGREPGSITRGELRRRVAALAAGLRSLGVERGDRVVAYLPNSP